jgi:catechol 2,3-dioxygenase-like lactoylglutathione lyase family enzyme
MLASADVMAFVATTDLDRARGFYEGVLGLPVIEDDGLALAFDAHGTMLRVTGVHELTPAPDTVLGWLVADVAAAVGDLEARGVAFARYSGFEQDERGVWTAPTGAQVAWFTDPDGNTLQLTQMPN